MVLLKDTLCRLRLTGPLTQSIVSQTLAPFVMKSVGIVERTRTMKDGSKQGLKRRLDSDVKDDVVKHDWWTNYCKDSPEFSSSLIAQCELWQQISMQITSPSQLPPSIVIPLTVTDPRLAQPVTKQPSQEDQIATHLAEGSLSVKIEDASKTGGCILSPLWNSAVRDYVTTTKTSDCELNRMRSQRLIPGEPLQEEINNASVVPLLLVQRPGVRDTKCSRLGFGGGWDIIAPAGWAMALWMALVFRGARVGGLREAEAIRFESGNLPELAPDSIAGFCEERNVEERLKEEYFKKPPKKRPNYIKFGVPSPFRNLWNILLSDWLQKDVSEFFVTRNLLDLNHMKELITTEKAKSQSRKTPLAVMPILSEFSRVNCLYGVKLTLTNGGRPSAFARICLPEKIDLKSMKAPTQSTCSDSYAKERNALRKEHQQLLKRLRRQRVRVKRRLEDKEVERRRSKTNGCDTDDEVKNEECKGDTKSITEEYASKIKNLWLPEKRTNLKDTGIRKTIGFVCSGGFSYSEARGSCVGYVVLPALLELLVTLTWNPELLVLVRNPTSLHYSFATFQIV